MDIEQENKELKRILMELKQNYALAIREAWVDGFREGCGREKVAADYAEKHYGNSKFRKGLK